jgi:hypothetical protein
MRLLDLALPRRYIRFHVPTIRRRNLQRNIKQLKAKCGFNFRTGWLDYLFWETLIACIDYQFSSMCITQ